MQNPRSQRKKIRLDSAAYRTEGEVFSITIGTDPRRPIFDDLELGDLCIQLLQKLSDQKGNPVYAYCIMPDHAHLVLGALPGSPIPAFVGAWKSLSYRERRSRGASERFWQRSYFDHGLRRDEDLLTVCRYVLNNPVRAGLVEVFEEYPLCGSLEFDLES